MKKVLVCLLILGFIPMIFSGCWNYKEVTQLSLLAGIAIDYTDSGEFLLTFEVADLHEMGEKSQVKSVLVEAKGQTLFEAARNVISKSLPKLYWGHATTVIISQDVASSGRIAEVIDFLCRDAEPRLTMAFIISQTKMAREIFEAQAPASEIRSTEINEILDDAGSQSKIVSTPLIDFIKAFSAKGQSAIATALNVEEKGGEKAIVNSGTAIFKKEKLVGFINPEDTAILNFVLDNIKGGVYVVKTDPENAEKKISLELLKSKTRIKPSYAEGKLSMEILIETSVALNEIGGSVEYEGEEAIRILGQKAEAQLKSQIEDFVRKVQREYGADIFGFGQTVYKNLPQVWREMHDEWDTVFSELEVTANPIIVIKHAGLLRKPIKPGD